jgi:rhamnulokinase
MSKENSMIALAFDLGGSSGKAVAGRFDGRRLHVHEIHRFRNDSVRVSGRLHWDILRLLHEIKQGIAAAVTAGLGDIESLAVDAWGCDFGLLDRHQELIGNPYHYRDELARGAMEEVLQIVPRTEIFARTGCQFLPINTLYQLYALRQARVKTLERGDAAADPRSPALLLDRGGDDRGDHRLDDPVPEHRDRRLGSGVARAPGVAN